MTCLFILFRLKHVIGCGPQARGPIPLYDRGEFIKNMSITGVYAQVWVFTRPVSFAFLYLFY